MCLNKLASLYKAGQINKNAINHGISLIKVGLSKFELDNAIGQFIIDNSGYPTMLGYEGYPGNCCISVNHEIVHSPPSDYKFKDGDVVKLDVSVTLEGLCTDSARTIIVGAPKNEDVHLIEQTKKCLDEILKIVKVGVGLLEIARIGDTIPDIHIFPSFCGHGTGEALHIPPHIFSTTRGVPQEELEKIKNVVLKEGDIIALEPIATLGNVDYKVLEDKWTAVTLDNSKVAHFEDTILVTANGCEILT